MKLHLQNTSTLNTVTAYDESYIEINKERYFQSVYFTPESPIHTWDIKSFEDIDINQLELVGMLEKAASSAIDFLNSSSCNYKNAPELIIIGTGLKQHLPDPSLITPLIKANIGVEFMKTDAAARTYNVLMAEGRKVALGLILEFKES
ncbi:Mth938-like domain-containing protein [Taylorella equigenitalis]|uniref:Membrane protein n=3 Tax=Taylorella equigenitalis TaxID=29575 RepID=A0A654KIF9_TAYEM|nr:Mth938-like domain-containing protein [Taylorella equigenitalis]ADU92241.1 Membrane protein [Taylorella equigenitalis MCE9]AFN35795.1 hypothetical protein KUI_0715 [Taylorella equigenitalis ATCC 35865]ASY30435.1 hypothetical protein B9Z30_03450 [Taylorella equigenitalis]ASY37742.1 hypothetical protein CA605_03375 [Taylorella equigenitalis]ASY39210.1 hypothetical protein CA604_03560 [Taylorella equigenitalis]